MAPGLRKRLWQPVRRVCIGLAGSRPGSPSLAARPEEVSRHESRWTVVNKRPASLASVEESTMKTEGESQRVRVYIGESDQWHGKPLFAAIVERCRMEGLA